MVVLMSAGRGVRAFKSIMEAIHRFCLDKARRGLMSYSECVRVFTGAHQSPTAIAPLPATSARRLTPPVVRPRVEEPTSPWGGAARPAVVRVVRGLTVRRPAVVAVVTRRLRRPVRFWVSRLRNINNK